MNTPTILVIVGITGDLSKRKLLPAIRELKTQGVLPERFHLLGVTRQEGIVIEDVSIVQMDLDSADDYQKLKMHIEAIKKDFGDSTQVLYYLSVAPTVSLPIIVQLAHAGLNGAQTKLLLEKPFGTDLESAKKNSDTINQYFPDSQVYRIDHYLQKHSVRALMDTTIQLDGLESISVVATEAIAIEGRVDFYEQTGALRDFVQSHLLEVLAVMLGKNHRLEILRSLTVVPELTKRGQYDGYSHAVGHASATETYVSVALRSNIAELSHVSFTLASGKALSGKNSEIQIAYTGGGVQSISLNDVDNAYANVFTDAIQGKKTFFVSPEEVIEDWRIVTPIQEYWSINNDDLFIYIPGTLM